MRDGESLMRARALAGGDAMKLLMEHERERYFLQASGEYWNVIKQEGSSYGYMIGSSFIAPHLWLKYSKISSDMVQVSKEVAENYMIDHREDIEIIRAARRAASRLLRS